MAEKTSLMKTIEPSTLHVCACVCIWYTQFVNKEDERFIWAGVFEFRIHSEILFI